MWSSLRIFSCKSQFFARVFESQSGVIRFGLCCFFRFKFNANIALERVRGYSRFKEKLSRPEMAMHYGLYHGLHVQPVCRGSH